jgi:hypothetical protein
MRVRLHIVAADQIAKWTSTMLRATQVVAALIATMLCPVALAQKSTGHMQLDDMSTTGGPRLAIARVAISRTDADCPDQKGMIRIGTYWGVKDTVVVLPSPGDWTIETAAPDPDDFSFRRRLATASCRIDIDVSKQQQRNGEWIPLSKQSPERMNADRTPKVDRPATVKSAESPFDRYNRARASAGSLRQGVLGIFTNNLWKGEVQDCFEAVGIYLIDPRGVTLLFPTDLGEKLNRFFLERVDVDADHSTLYLSRGSCRVGFTISASILSNGSWTPLAIAPFESPKQGAEKN